MKYKEFREYLKLNKIDLKEDEERLIANHHFEISKTKEHSIIFLVHLVDSPYELDLTEKVIELAKTPLDEREEKYYLKHKFINNHNGLDYINLSMDEKVILNNHLEDEGFKTKFTKAEIEEFKEKFDTDLNDFELIEVED